MKPETRIVRACLDWYKRHYPAYQAWKNETVSNKGKPDIFINHGGIFCAVEIKDFEKEPTPLQAQNIKLIKAGGGVAGSADTLEGFRHYVEMAEAVRLKLMASHTGIPSAK